MRRGAKRLASALASESSSERLIQVGAWFEQFRRACLIHAEGEDKVLWPALSDARPDLSNVFAVMEGEHDELARLLDDLADSLSDHERLSESRDSARRLVDLVDRHLDHEELQAVPALVDVLGPELGDLMRRVQQSAGPEGAAVAVPFLLEHATDAERDAVLAAVPPPVREGYESSWRDAYRRLAAAVDA